MTPWVHRSVGSAPWRQAARHEPPLPPPVPGRGYAIFNAEIDGVTYAFASLPELDLLIDTFENRLLSPTHGATRIDAPVARANRHWLSRLPSTAKPFGYRMRAAAYLRRVRPTFAAAVGVAAADPGKSPKKRQAMRRKGGGCVRPPHSLHR